MKLSTRSLFRKPTQFFAGAHRFAERWARRRQGGDGSRVTLTNRRVYILPTGIGLIYGLALFLMLLAAMNYSNSLAFVLTFFLAACGLVTMHVTHANLTGLEISAGTVDRAFAGEPLRQAWLLGSNASRERLDIEVRLPASPVQPHDVLAGDHVIVELNTPTTERGLMATPRFSVRTIYPLGLFRAWSWVHPTRELLVWPRLATDPPPLPDATGGGHTHNLSDPGNDEFDRLREYQAGDAPKTIAWKALASRDQLATKAFAAEGGENLLLDWAALSRFELEERISILARWIETCELQRRPYELRLPNGTFPASLGATHRRQCLDALALLPKVTP